MLALVATCPGASEMPLPAGKGLKRVWNSFRIFFLSRFGFFFDFLAGTICLVFATGLELESVILHGICYIWHVHLPVCMDLLHVGMFTFHFVWYLPHFGMFTFHLHGMFYMWACSPSILYGILPNFGMFTFHFAWDVLHVSMLTQIFTDAEAWIR